MTPPTVHRSRIPWMTLSIEAILVVVSVLLALVLNSCREGHAEHQRAVRVLQDLVDEAVVNCGRIQMIGAYHRAVAERDRPAEGIRIGLLTNDAWQSAQSTGTAAFVDDEVAAIAGRVFANQRDHRTIVQSYAQAVFTALARGVPLDDMHGDLDVAAIREMVRIQDRLTASYDELRTAIAAHYDAVDADPICQTSSE